MAAPKSEEVSWTTIGVVTFILLFIGRLVFQLVMRNEPVESSGRYVLADIDVTLVVPHVPTPRPPGCNGYGSVRGLSDHRPGVTVTVETEGRRVLLTHEFCRGEADPNGSGNENPACTFATWHIGGFAVTDPQRIVRIAVVEEGHVSLDPTPDIGEIRFAMPGTVGSFQDTAPEMYCGTHLSYRLTVTAVSP